MNPLTDIVFSLTWIFLLVWAIRSISKGWDTNLNSPKGMWTTQVKKPMHPEMIDVQPGEELMGVTFDKPSSCDLEEYKALQKRIEELKIELAMEEDDDEDDDGGIISRV